MATYGYRLFAVQLRRGNGRKAVKFNDCAGEHYVQVAERLLKALSVRTMVGDAPSDPSEIVDTVTDEEEAVRKGYIDQPAFRVEDVRVVDRTVRATVWCGKFGSHERALGTGEPSDDADISEKAACRQFRLVLALPEAGETGILGVEDISRSCPVGPVTRWLRWRSQQDAAVPKALWWKLHVEPLADEKRLIEMIRRGEVDRVELVKHSITSARTRQSEEFRITANVLDQGKLLQLVDVVRGWIKRLKRVSDTEDDVGDLVTGVEAARQLAAIVGPKIVDLDLDDGWVVLQDEDGKNKKIKPNQMSEIFTYAQPRHVKAETPTFYALIRDTAQQLQVAHDVIFDWPSQ